MENPSLVWMFILSTAMTGFGWFLRTLWQDHKETAAALMNFKLEVAKEYVPSSELEGMLNRFDARFDKLERKLDTLFTRT